ncbi:unnamed protein product [Caenorhabditis brenneri]
MGNWRSRPRPPPPRAPSVDSENLTSQQIGENGLFIGVNITVTSYTIVILDERWRGNDSRSVTKIAVAPRHFFHIREKSDKLAAEDVYRSIVFAVLGNLKRLLSGRYKERRIKHILVCHEFQAVLEQLARHFEPLSRLSRFQGRFFDCTVSYSRVYEMYYDLVFYNKKSRETNAILYWDSLIWFMHGTHTPANNRDARERMHEDEEVFKEPGKVGDEGSAYWTAMRVINRICSIEGPELDPQSSTYRREPYDWTEEMDLQYGGHRSSPQPRKDLVPLDSEINHHFGVWWWVLLDHLRGDRQRAVTSFATWLCQLQWVRKPFRISNITNEADNVIVQEFRETAKIILNKYLKRCLTKGTQKVSFVIIGIIAEHFDKILSELPPLDIDSDATVNVYSMQVPLTEPARAAALLASMGWDDETPLIPTSRFLRHTFRWHK